MSQLRDSLSEQARPGYDAAVQALGNQFAAARRKRDELYQREGAMGVARAAYVPGGPSIEDLAEGYERLAERARQRQAAA